MSSPAPAKQEKSATKPCQQMQGHIGNVFGVLRMPDKGQIITCSWDGSLRVWDFKSGMQIGDAWQDEGSGDVHAIALSPDGKTVTSGSDDSAVRLWDIDTGNVIKKWTGHTEEVFSVCWSPDGGRVASGSRDSTFRVWNVESGETIIGPIETGYNYAVWTVRYSPDGTMIATGGSSLKIWDANTADLLKTFGGYTVFCLTWTSDEKTLIAAGSEVKKFDTATWTEIAVLDEHGAGSISRVSLSPNERILASVSSGTTARLWNLENNQPIGLPLKHEYRVECVAFSADGKVLVTGGNHGHMYTWDVIAILRDAGLEDLMSDSVNADDKSAIDADATSRRVPQIKDCRRLPPAFFDDFSTSRGVSSHGQRDRRTTAPRQRTLLGHLPSFWRRRRRHESNIELQEPPVVDVPFTAGKPRNYHARGKTAASSSRPPNTHVMQKPPATATGPTTPFSVAAVPSGTPTRPDIIIGQAAWRARFMLWVCCVPLQHTDGQH